jgi:hypothetical protein
MKKFTISPLTIPQWLSPRWAIFVTAVVALIGGLAAMSAFAASFSIATETEAGTLGSNATLVSDTNASGGQAVKFSGSGNTGTCPSSIANAPDGPDPWGGCWPGPQTTGVPAGTTLTAYTGPMTITTDNTVIDSKNITGDLVIQAKNVTVSKSKITNGEILLDEDTMPNNTAWSATVIDSEVDAGGPKHINDSTPCTSQETNAVCNARSAVSTANFTVLRSNIHGGQTAVQCDMDNHGTICDVEDSWLHGQLNGAQSDAIPWHLGGSLSDGMNPTSSYKFVHNRAACDWPVNALEEGCTGDLNLISNFAPIHDVHVEKNFFVASNGLSYCTYGGFKSYTGSNIVYLNNVFQRNDTSSGGTTTKCGHYGAVTDFKFGWTGNLWLNNMWDDGTPLNCDSSDNCF